MFLLYWVLCDHVPCSSGYHSCTLVIMGRNTLYSCSHTCSLDNHWNKRGFQKQQILSFCHLSAMWKLIRCFGIVKQLLEYDSGVCWKLQLYFLLIICCYVCLQEHSGFVATDRPTSYSSVELEKSHHESHIHLTHGQTGSEGRHLECELYFTLPVR